MKKIKVYAYSDEWYGWWATTREDLGTISVEMTPAAWARYKAAEKAFIKELRAFRKLVDRRSS